MDMVPGAAAPAPIMCWSEQFMTQLATAPLALFRNRDLFVHDGTKLRRVRLSAPFQAALFLILLTLVGWSSYATVRFLSGAAKSPTTIASLAAATEARAHQIEQRQALIEAMLLGGDVDPTVLKQAVAGRLPQVIDGPLDRIEGQQALQAALAARALDARYELTAAELQRLGFTLPKPGQDAMGGPSDSGDPTFKQLFMSWKKLDSIADTAIAVPSDKPVKSAAFMSAYGNRRDPFEGHTKMHQGIDLAAPLGTPIYATADGVISEAGWNSGGYGNLIKVSHGKGIETRYAHLSSVAVRSGQRVRRGELIGRMGSTGRSTGSHLHYEVRIEGRAVNPIPFMRSTDYLVAMRSRANSAPMDAVAMGGPAGGK